MNELASYLESASCGIPSMEGRLYMKGSLEEAVEGDVVLVIASDSGLAQKGIASLVESFARLTKSANAPALVVGGLFRLVENSNDNAAGLRFVIESLLARRLFPLILSNNGEHNAVIAEALSVHEQLFSVTIIGAQIHLDPDGFLAAMVKAQPNFLATASCLGYQRYLVDANQVQLAEQFHFELLPLGEARANLALCEPPMRGSELVSFSLASIRCSDFGSTTDAQPNGFRNDEACLLMRYVGLSEKIKVVHLCDWAGEFITNADTLQVAEMIWHMLEALGARTVEIPSSRSSSFLKYSVPLAEGDHTVVFYRSMHTDRWWLEVPIPGNTAGRYESSRIVACSFHDYEMASRSELPDRWLLHYNRFA